MSNSVKSTEDIEIGHYSNSKIELKDKASGKLKMARAMDDTPGH